MQAMVETIVGREPVRDYITTVTSRDDAFGRFLRNLEARSGVDRMKILWIIISSSCYYLISGSCAHLYSNIIAVAYPLVISLDMIVASESDDGKSSKDDDSIKILLLYWCIYGSVTAVEGSGQLLSENFPLSLYWLLRTAGFIALYEPQLGTLAKFYSGFLKPVIRLREGKMELATLKQMNPSLRDAIGITPDMVEGQDYDGLGELLRTVDDAAILQAYRNLVATFLKGGKDSTHNPAAPGKIVEKAVPEQDKKPPTLPPKATA